MSAYVPPHRRRNQSDEVKVKKCNGGGTNNNKPPFRRKADHDDGPEPAFCPKNDFPEPLDMFTRIRCINLRKRQDRWASFCSRMQSTLGERVLKRVERFDAVDGVAIMARSDEENRNDPEFPSLEWDASKNSMYDRHIQPPMKKIITPGEVGCSMSHVRLWKELVMKNEADSIMLILEDDAVFYTSRRNKNYHHHHRDPWYDRNKGRSLSSPGFFEALSETRKKLPKDWDILYLGFSDRGERVYVQQNDQQQNHHRRNHGEPSSSINIHLFLPTYGFHTHAYALSSSAASTLVSKLPVTGPLDVWLADNEWFGLKVYCSVVANEGWKGQGACLISQRKHDTKSDIVQSGRKHHETI